MFSNFGRKFLLCFVINLSLSPTEGLSIPRESDEFLLQNVTKIWKAVDPKVTTIILHDVVDGNTCFGICNAIGSRGPVTTVTFAGLENCSLNPGLRVSVKRMVLLIHTANECPTTGETQKVINTMRTQCWWLQRSHLLYLLATTGLCNNVKFMYQQYWDLRFLRISIMTYDVQNTGSLTLHKCNPFTGFCELKPDPSSTAPFPDGVENMQGFTLTRSVIHPRSDESEVGDDVTSLHQVGPEIDLKIVDLLIERLNATKRTTDYVHKYGSWTRSPDANMLLMVASDLADGKSDILSHTSFILQSRGEGGFTERTTFSEFSQLCAIVPIDYQVTVNQFEGILVLLTIILCIGIGYVASILLRLQSKAGTPLHIFLILVGGGLPHPPMRWPPRVLLITWLLLSMILSTAMQNRIMSSLMIKPAPIQIQTLSELNASGRVLLANPSLEYVIFKEVWDNPTIEDIRDRSEPYRSIESNCPELIQGSWKANATCLLETPAALWFIKSTMRDNSPVFAITDECFVNRYKQFQVSLGSPYLPSIDILLLRMHDFGILTKLIEDTWLAVPYTATQSPEPVDSELSGISWDSFRQAYFCILGGDCLAAVIFCLELIVHYTWNSLRKFIAMKYVDTGFQESRTSR